MIKTSEELLNKFPELGFNIDNCDIVEKYQKFLDFKNKKGTVLTTKNIRLHVREYFKKEFNITFPNVNKNSPKFWFARGYSEEEAKVKAREFYDTNMRPNRFLPTQLEYYIKKGMSKEDAKTALTKEQLKRCNKLIKKETADPSLRKRRLWNQIEYWTNKGYSEEQGYQLMAEKFQTRNLQTFKKLVDKFIKQGDDNETANEKALKHYKTKARKIMKTRIKNNSFGFQKASQQSLNFFKPLMDHLDKQGIEYYVGVEGNAEWFLASGTEHFYSYDFCIPSQKLIIEFHGEHVHPNPKMPEDKWKEWKHCWTQKTADECRDEDLKKIYFAESKGYKVHEIFESDNVKSIELI